VPATGVECVTVGETATVEKEDGVLVVSGVPFAPPAWAVCWINAVRNAFMVAKAGEVEDDPDGEAAPGEPAGELYERVQPASKPATAKRHHVFLALNIFPPKNLENTHVS
jgi:hypothetical protein